MGKVIVIGGGPAGMMAARTAASRGMEVILLEKMERLGRKLAITGKGRCNITNAADIEDMMEQIIGNKYFLYSALYQFTNTQVIEYFNELGVKTKVERGNRVFPESDKAMEVVEAMVNDLVGLGVKIYTKKEVKEILVEENKTCGVKCEDGSLYNGDKVIITTGGLSYPRTGSTGEGYRMAKKIGHTVIRPLPSLVPLESNQPWVRALQGVSLKNVSIKIMKDHKKVYSEMGEMLFTHFGISGPIILSGSRSILDHMTEEEKKTLKLKDCQVILDLKPALDEKTLDQRIQRDFEEFSRKQFKNALDKLLPNKMIDEIIKLSEIDGEKPVHQVTKEERLRLVKLLKQMTIEISKLRAIEEAIVTAGGISVDEINPSTMESKLVEGLYFAGEVIDVDAYTGGYNLQIAFSTGYLAGMNC